MQIANEHYFIKVSGFDKNILIALISLASHKSLFLSCLGDDEMAQRMRGGARDRCVRCEGGSIRISFLNNQSPFKCTRTPGRSAPIFSSGSLRSMN